MTVKDLITPAKIAGFTGKAQPLLAYDIKWVFSLCIDSHCLVLLAFVFAHRFHTFCVKINLKLEKICTTFRTQVHEFPSVSVLHISTSNPVPWCISSFVNRCRMQDANFDTKAFKVYSNGIACFHIISPVPKITLLFILLIFVNKEQNVERTEKQNTSTHSDYLISKHQGHRPEL